MLVSLWSIYASAQDALSLSPTLSLQPESAPPPFPEQSASQSTNWNVGLTMGAGFGLSAMGSTVAHDLAVATLHIGKRLASEKPILRHVEVGGELWTGAQYHPDRAYLVGLTPIVRYHFMPGSRWTPFIDGGAGVTATDIGRPDLSTIFEFNLQAGAGFHWTLRQDMAFTFQARYIHLSNAHIDTPNLGVNSLLFSVGLTKLL